MPLGSYIPEMGTRVSVSIDTEGLDEAINVLKSDPTGSLFTDLISDLQGKKGEMRQAEKDLSLSLSQALVQEESDYIRSHHYVTGNMANSTQIWEEGTNYAVVGTGAHNSRNNFPYPIIIEYGSRKFVGDPFIQDSIDRVDRTKENYIDEILNPIME